MNASVLSEILPANRNFDTDHDDLLLLTARRAIAARGYPLLRQLRCQVRSGVVSLSGIVPSFFLKQLAQEAVLQLDRVRKVKNLIEVRRPEFV